MVKFELIYNVLSSIVNSTTHHQFVACLSTPYQNKFVISLKANALSQLLYNGGWMGDEGGIDMRENKGLKLKDNWGEELLP